MNERTGDSEAAKPFKRFVENIAGIEVGSNKNVGIAFDDGSGEFFGGDFGVDGGVKLHFAVYEPIWMVLANLVDSIMDFWKVGIFTAGAVSGIGKNGDSRLSFGKRFESLGGIFDNSVELFFCGLLIDAAVGESENLFAFLADETTGEKGRF